MYKLIERVERWFKYHTIFGSSWNEYHNPYYWWWKAKKYFKRPKAHWICGEYSGYFGLPINTKSYKAVNFFCEGLGWKSKYNSPRHEWDPIVCVIFKSPFKTKIKSDRFGDYTTRKQYWFGWVFNWIDKKDVNSNTRSMATWEALLDIAVYNKDLKQARNSHIWMSGTDENSIEITIDKNIKRI